VTKLRQDAEREFPEFQIVLASVTAASAERLLGYYERPDLIDGIVEAAARRVATDVGQPIAVLCTESTKRTGVLKRALRARIGNPMAVRACPGLARAIDASVSKRQLCRMLPDYLPLDPGVVIVPGCSHFFGLGPVVEQVTGRAGIFVDPTDTFLDMLLENQELFETA
jgi:glutamate racemase